MRLFLQIVVLFALTLFLVLQFPRRALFFHPAPACPPARPFAAFVELTPAAYAARMKSARAAWQIRARAAGRLDLDDGTLLGAPALPPPVFRRDATPFPAIPRAPSAPVVPDPLAPPSVAAPAPADLAPLPARPDGALLDLSPYATLQEGNLP